MTDKELSVLKEAIWKHKLLIIKGQKSLEPKKQWEFMLRLDPEAPQTTPELFMKDFHPEGEGLLVRAINKPSARFTFICEL
jgi:xanthine dioxygenase